MLHGIQQQFKLTHFVRTWYTYERIKKVVAMQGNICQVSAKQHVVFLSN